MYSVEYRAGRSERISGGIGMRSVASSVEARVLADHPGWSAKAADGPDTPRENTLAVPFPFRSVRGFFSARANLSLSLAFWARVISPGESRDSSRGMHWTRTREHVSLSHPGLDLLRVDLHPIFRYRARGTADLNSRHRARYAGSEILTSTRRRRL